MGNLTGFPPEVHTLAGKFQDKMHVFDQRDPARPRYEVRHAGQMAVKLLGDLIDRLVEFRAELDHAVEGYAELVRKEGT